MEFERVSKEIYNPISENIKKLEELFPSVIKDGQVDFIALKKELGFFETVNEKLSERYELGWAGKEEARLIAATDAVGRTLKYVPEDSKNPDNTGNLYIEGDNLEVLKLIRNSYYNKIKMIYIDPPYNTGNDFIYNDKFQTNNSQNAFLEGEVNNLGERLIVNQKSSGRYHSNWLNMMYPRMKVARDLLADDGVIFISIDDNELHNTLKLGNEIFGEDNFVTIFIWEKKKKPSFLHKNIGKLTDYIVCYTKSSNSTFPFSIETTTKGKKYPLNNAGNSLAVLSFPAFSVKFNMKDQIIEPQDMSEGNIKTKLLDRIEIKNGRNVNKFSLEGEWRYSQEKLNEIVANNEEIIISKIPFRPNHLKAGGEIKKMKNMLTPVHYKMETNEDATQQMIDLFGTDIFDNPKPVKLLYSLTKAVTYNDKNAIVLDFFSGAATTAHAVMKLNAEDGGGRKFIMVQILETCNKKSQAYRAGYKNICEIGKERIRRAGEKIVHENSKSINNLDTGFKVFRTGDTNIRWFSEAINNVNFTLEEGILSDKDRLDFNPGYKDIDVVYEILLRHREIPLSTKVKQLEIGKRTYIFADTVLVYLDEKVTEEIIDKIAKLKPMPVKIIFRDSAFEDNISLKTNSMLRLQVQMAKNSGKKKKTYRVEFI